MKMVAIDVLAEVTLNWGQSQGSCVPKSLWWKMQNAGANVLCGDISKYKSMIIDWNQLDSVFQKSKPALWHFQSIRQKLHHQILKALLGMIKMVSMGFFLSVDTFESECGLQ
jgi:hypothetical protein